MGKRSYYYSKQRIMSSAGATVVDGSTFPVDRLIKNNYVHTGIYNFQAVTKQVDKTLTLSMARDKLLEEFNQEILKSQAREAFYYQQQGVENYSDLQQSITLGSFGNEVWDKLSLYDMVNEIVDKALLENPNGNKTISKEKFNQLLQKVVDERFSQLKIDYDSIYSPLLDGFKQDSLLQVKKNEKIYLDVLKKSPSAYFSNISAYQGMVGEFATLLDSLINESIDANTVATELFQNGTNFQNVKIVAPKGKADISKFSIGLSVKNYKQTKTDSYSVALHSGKSLRETFLQDITEISQSSDLGLNDLINSNIYNSDILDYFSYVFVNLYAFNTSGGYLSIEDRRARGGQNFVRQDLTSQFSFIKDFLKYTSIYWIGEKILNSYSSAGQNVDPVAFLVLNKKVIPVSKILIAIRDDLAAAQVNASLSMNKAFYNANVMREEKLRALKQTRKTSGFGGVKKYPDPLLKIGSTIGNAIVDQVKFGVKLKIDLSNF